MSTALLQQNEHSVVTAVVVSTEIAMVNVHISVTVIAADSAMYITVTLM